jgi:cyanophycinase-like exopeptidase
LPQTFSQSRQQLDPRVKEMVDALSEGCGALGLLSSDEFTSAAEAFDRALLEVTGPRVAILLCADPEAAKKQAKVAREHFSRLDAEPTVLDVLDRKDAAPGKLPDCDVLFIGGGNPSTLLESLGGTLLWNECLHRWMRGMPIAGSSAGAMALCAHCLYPEPGADMPTRWSRGIGPISRFALAVHASSRPAEWLQEISRDAPVPVVAMDEATGLILQPGFPPRVAGGGRVWVVDPASG